MSNIPNLLRPNQVEDHHDAVNRLEGVLSSPHAQDKAHAKRQLNGIKHELATLTPTAYGQESVDQAVKQEEELREAILEGMPTQEEMRRAPPGAVGKHMRWEAKHKDQLLAWKHVMLRLNAGSNDPDTANFERFRPSGGGGQMNMDGALIEKTRIMHIPQTSAPPVVFSEEQVSTLRDLDPDMADKLAMLSNEEREQVKAVMTSFLEPKAFLEEKPKPPTEFSKLRATAKELGINAFGKGAEILKEEIAAAQKVA